MRFSHETGLRMAGDQPGHKLRGLLLANLAAVLTFGLLTSLPWIGVGYCVFVSDRQCPVAMRVSAQVQGGGDTDGAQVAQSADDARTEPEEPRATQRSAEPAPVPEASVPQGNATGGGTTSSTDEETEVPVQAPSKFAFDDAMAREYRQLFDTMVVKPERIALIDRHIAKMTSQPLRGYYDEVEKATGVPWYVVAIKHDLEASLNLTSHLINGDPLSARTFTVPAGRPATGNPPFTWTESAIDAMEFDRFVRQPDWSLERTLYLLEKSNGFGARRHKINTYYLWSFSNHYTKGKYVADAVWAADAVSQQPGAAVILKRLIQLGKLNAPPNVGPIPTITRAPITREPPVEQESARIALIIGNGNYMPGVAPLKNAKADAADVAAALREHGFRIFGHPKTNFSREELFAVVKKFETAARQADVAMAWYAGHGFQFRTSETATDNMLIPVDFAPGDDLIQRGFPLSRLVNSVTYARKLPIVVVDACRNSGLSLSERGDGRGFSRVERSRVLIVYSTRPGATASDGTGRNSPFAAAFLERFKAKPGLDVRKLFAGVAKGTRDRTNQEQSPEKIDSLDIEDEAPLAD